MIDVSARRQSPQWTAWTNGEEIDRFIDKYPRFTRDGTKITDQHQYLMAVILEALFGDLQEQLISMPVGRHELTGVFDVYIEEECGSQRMVVDISLKEVGQ